MEVMHARCCGLEVHKETVVACVRLTGADGPSRQETRTFRTMTDGLLALADWLAAAAGPHVALESPGVSWKPVWNLVEGQCCLLLGKAQHVKRVPGRKSDLTDAAWRADLLRHGVLRGSVVPQRGQRELRELTRDRSKLVAERAAEVNRGQTTLEGAHLKLAAVASNIVGVSGRPMVAALVAGEDDPAVLAQLAQGRRRETAPAVARALAGRIGPPQRVLLARQLAHRDFLDATIAAVSTEIAERLRPFAAAQARLQTIPGVGQRTAQVLLAEIGPALRRFPRAGHLASWAGMGPGNNESAGKRRRGTTRKGRPARRAALIEAAHAAARSQGTYLAAQYRRLAARRGAKKAAVAVGHSILVSVYHLLRDGEDDHDLGGAYVDERDRQAVERRLVRRLEALGHKVTLAPAA